MSDESLRGDELISAYLDGEATPAEVAEVEGDDTLMARAEQLRAVRDAVAAPAPTMSAERRDQMISAALAAADVEAAHRREAKIVPIHRRRETLLAVAAAAILLAAVVSAGLIASRGGGEDDSTQMAADAPALAEAEPAAPPDAMAEAEMAAPADDMAATTTAAYAEMADEPMAEEEPMAEVAAAAEEMDEEAMDAMAMAEPESAMEAPAEETVATTSSGAADAAEAAPEAEDGRRDANGSALQAVDLGTLEDLESLFDGIAARSSAALVDDAMADTGSCSAAVTERVLELSAEVLLSFIATIGAEDPPTIDAQLARLADGTGLIAYAVTPDCEIEIHELGPLDSP